MDLIKHIHSKFNPNIILNLSKSNLTNTFNDLYEKYLRVANSQLNYLNGLKREFELEFRRHRGGKVKNKVRNVEKRKKKEQFLISTLDKYPKDNQPKSE